MASKKGCLIRQLNKKLGMMDERSLKLAEPISVSEGDASDLEGEDEGRINKLFTISRSHFKQIKIIDKVRDEKDLTVY